LRLSGSPSSFLSPLIGIDGPDEPDAQGPLAGIDSEGALLPSASLLKTLIGTGSLRGNMQNLTSFTKVT
jgi:hypothetical protein